MKRLSFVVMCFSLLGVLVACGNSDTESSTQGSTTETPAPEQPAATPDPAATPATPAAPSTGTPAAAAAPAAAPAAPAAGAAPAGGASNFGTITLAPGFMPDPHMAGGTSGGAVQASTMNPACTGYVSTTPDHIFVATGDFSNLRFIVRSEADTTLVIRKPDGTFACNDDTEGFNPIVAGPFPTGTYQVWVGSFSEGTNAAYRLGVTELGSVTAASLQ